MRTEHCIIKKPDRLFIMFAVVKKKNFSHSNFLLEQKMNIQIKKVALTPEHCY